MSDYVVDAELREKTGKGEARRLRRAGKLPGVVYGGGKPDLPIVLDALAASKLLDDEGFYTAMLELKIKGSGKSSALVKDVQWHHLKEEANHIDFYRVSSSDSVTMEVPVHAINHEKCPGIIAGGVLSVTRHALEVTCRADSIPDSIEVDCSALDIGDSIHIEEIALPEGAEVTHDVNFSVLSLVAPTKSVEQEEEEAAAAAAAAGEGVEGEEGVEGAEGAEGAEGTEAEKAEGSED